MKCLQKDREYKNKLPSGRITSQTQDKLMIMKSLASPERQALPPDRK